MKIPNSPSFNDKGLDKKNGFSIRFFLGVIFILFGILVVLDLFNVKFIENDLIIQILKYGTALGSIIGGFFMLFRRKSKELKI